MRKITLLVILLLVASASLFIYELTEDLTLTLLVGVDMFVGAAVLSFAFVQVNLNRQLVKLQDYVAVSLVMRDGDLAFFNTGKLNVYIHKIEIKSKDTEELIISTLPFEKSRLIPPGTLDESYYAFPLTEKVFEYKSFIVLMYLTDELDRKWISEHGGEVLEDKNLRVWSHQTSKKNWKLDV